MTSAIYYYVSIYEVLVIIQQNCNINFSNFLSMFVCELTLFILTADKDELLDCYSTASSMEVYPDQQ